MSIGNFVENKTAGQLVTITANFDCLDFTITSGNYTNSGTINISISGNVDIAGASTYTKGTGEITLIGTTKTVETNGTRHNTENIIIDVGASYTFLDTIEPTDWENKGAIILTINKTYITDNPSGAGTWDSDTPGTDAFVCYTGSNTTTGILTDVVFKSAGRPGGVNAYYGTSIGINNSILAT